MTKVEFSPAGFKDLEAQLHALDDNALNAEATAVMSDYIDWADNHIILSAAQLSYLQGLDRFFVASLASKAAIAFVNRLPLNLVLPVDYEQDDENEGRGKWFLDSSTIAASNTPGASVQATGELIYEFELE
ncbi:MAG: hypothetical protein BGO31_20740 [Bacteroidetes bacterium 43-16]|uniref:hypothetical protein n=1 Tax=uncultured Dysgonomonas sp. TaxID=206096 RepID=UPI000927D5E4|nr:hypothetical protein [uncultured Dysgonomonas sp.]OJV55359.1 MAG: hypothetical protein BGO31_20740 [Bacteroidetes bacterium 43-16]